MHGEHTADDEMSDNDNGEIGRGVIGTVMMQVLAAMGTCVGDLEVLPKQLTFAALRTALRKATPHGLHYIAARPVGDHYRHEQQMLLAHLNVDEPIDPGARRTLPTHPRGTD